MVARSFANASRSDRITASSAAHDEVEHVVIIDAVIDQPVREPVPDALRQAARHDPRVRQFAPNQFIGDDFVDGIAQRGDEKFGSGHGHAPGTPGAISAPT